MRIAPLKEMTPRFEIALKVGVDSRKRLRTRRFALLRVLRGWEHPVPAPRAGGAAARHPAAAASCGASLGPPDLAACLPVSARLRGRMAWLPGRLGKTRRLPGWQLG